MITKPTFLETDIWAGDQIEGAHIVEPDNAYKATGWMFGMKPPYTVENWIQNTKDKFLVHLNQNGILTWDNLTTYSENATVNYNNNFYIASQENTTSIPQGDRTPPAVTSADWVLDIPMTPDNIVIDTLGVADAHKVVMTNSDGLLEISLTAIGGMVYNGDIDVTVVDSAPTGAQAGDYYTAANEGTFDASWTGLAGEWVEQSETFIYADTGVWNMLGTGVHDNYLLRNGSKPMIGNLIVGLDDAVSVETKMYGDTFIGSLTNPWSLTTYGNSSVSGILTVTGTSGFTDTLTTTADIQVGTFLDVGGYADISTTLTVGTGQTVGLDDAVDAPTNLYGTTIIGSAANPWDLTTYGNIEAGSISIGGSDTVEVIEDTIGLRVIGGTKIESSYDDGTGETTLSHSVIDSQSSVDNSGANVIQDITLDEGHITAIASVEITSTITPYDNATSGLTATFVKDAIDELDTNTDNVISGTTDIDYDNASSGLTAVTVKVAIDEVALGLAQLGWPEEIDFIADGVQDTFVPAGGYQTDKIHVFVSGVKLRDVEFTATDGVNVVLDQVPDVDTWVQVECIQP